MPVSDRRLRPVSVRVPQTVCSGEWLTKHYAGVIAGSPFAEVKRPQAVVQFTADAQTGPCRHPSEL